MRHCALTRNQDDEINARIIKGCLERTTLGQVAKYIKKVYARDGCSVVIKLDEENIANLQLKVNASSVAKAIVADPKVKVKDKQVETKGPWKLTIRPQHDGRSKDSLHYTLIALANQMRHVIVCGIPTVKRAVIQTLPNGAHKKFQLFVEGTGLQDVMATSGVRGREATSNHVMEMQQVLGIEAARSTIMKEIGDVLSNYGISVDQRHMMLLADVMTYKGEVLGITRFGMAKMKESVLMLASFEKTVDHLFDAAIHGRSDRIVGVSECINLGTPVFIGTGAFPRVLLCMLRHQKNCITVHREAHHM